MQKHAGVDLYQLSLTHWPKPFSTFTFNVDGFRWDVEQFGEVFSQHRSMFDQSRAFHQNGCVHIANFPAQILSLEDGLS